MQQRAESQAGTKNRRFASRTEDITRRRGGTVSDDGKAPGDKSGSFNLTIAEAERSLCPVLRVPLASRDGGGTVIIKKRLPTGHQAVVHVEAVYGEEPFERCAALMGQYGVSMCVVEQLPNVNSARRFANAHRGRVFLAGYATDPKSDMISWGDQITRSDRKTSEEDRSRWTVNLQQYKAMQAALFRIKEGACLFPDPALLEQDVFDDHGIKRRVPILSEWVFLHFTKTALVVEQHPDTRQPKPKVMKVGIDPHFSYADMLCDVAWSRNHGSGVILLPVLPGAMTPPPKTDRAAAVERNAPGLPRAVINMLADQPFSSCGRCSAFRAKGDGTSGHCIAREFIVQARDPECPLFDPAPQPR